MVTRKMFTDPIVQALRSLGVMFANPPPGQTDLAGIQFDDAGNPVSIQNPAGVAKAFPGGGGGGGIPIPANNSGADVVINSDQGGNITISAPDETTGPGGNVSLLGGYSPDDNGGSVTIKGQNAFGYGGEVQINSGDGANGDAGGAQIYLQGGNGNPGQGANVVVNGGNNAPGSSGKGGVVFFQGGNASGTGDAGDVEFQVGGRLGGSGAPGKLRFSRAASGTLRVPNGAQTVTLGNLGPGASPLVVKGWLPLTIDGTDYFMPIFGA